MNRRSRCDFKMLWAHLLAYVTGTVTVAKRRSGGGEPDLERSDQGSVAAFGGEKETLAEMADHQLAYPCLSAGDGGGFCLRRLFEHGPESLISLGAFGRIPG